MTLCFWAALTVALMSPAFDQDVSLSVSAVDLNLDIANLDAGWFQDEAAEIVSKGIKHESFRCPLLTGVTRRRVMS